MKNVVISFTFVPISLVKDKGSSLRIVLPCSVLQCSRSLPSFLEWRDTFAIAVFGKQTLKF